MTNQFKWDLRFLEMAKLVSSWSKDPSTKTGAVITNRNRVVSVGYNGFAQSVEDRPERYANRDTKLKMMVHCERNAILFTRESLEGCTLYTHPFMSCSPCAAMVIQSGITRVVAPHNDNPRWQEDFTLADQQFSEASVEVELIDFSTTLRDVLTRHLYQKYSSECGWKTAGDADAYSLMREIEHNDGD